MSTDFYFQVRYFKFLYYSYCYYQLNQTIISDEEFDKLCVDILNDWEKFEHKYKNLITKDDLIAGTGFAIKYPEDLKDYLYRCYRFNLLEEVNNGKS